MKCPWIKLIRTWLKYDIHCHQFPSYFPCNTIIVVMIPGHRNLQYLTTGTGWPCWRTWWRRTAWTWAVVTRLPSCYRGKRYLSHGVWDICVQCICVLFVNLIFEYLYNTQVRNVYQLSAPMETKDTYHIELGVFHILQNSFYWYWYF